MIPIDPIAPIPFPRHTTKSDHAAGIFLAALVAVLIVVACMTLGCESIGTIGPDGIKHPTPAEQAAAASAAITAAAPFLPPPYNIIAAGVGGIIAGIWARPRLDRVGATTPLDPPAPKPGT